ncbi:MAG: hypothetical protein IPO21_09205 [Bacteroidales bacterium]|nr:hypothetical protein [Bacteroidales bacterium]
MRKKELNSKIYVTLKIFNNECIELKPNKIFRHINLSILLIIKYYRIVSKLKRMKDDEIVMKLKELPRFVWLTNEWLLHVFFLSIVSVLLFITYHYIPIFKGIGAWFIAINIFIYIRIRDGMDLRIVRFLGALTEIQEIIKKNYYVK